MRLTDRSTTVRPRVKPALDTKHRLLEAANELIWTQSYGSVSVDDICAKADVRKGSFYHFFPSKSDLAVAAIEECWQQSREWLDKIFSTQNPPLERIEQYCAAVYEHQKEKAKKIGKVCGCPFASLGSEQSTLDEPIRQKGKEIFNRMDKYLETTLRDAAREDLIGKTDSAAAARDVLALVEGILLEAKVQNDLEIIKRLKPAVFRFLGISQHVK
ncbi:MAG: Transcriptional regulator AcuR [Verrucomicrobiae bacterium]|nr:Transcriptional regulator AcuR [Verrucomicrobiae bacterium]